jgi:hypothetical protein
MKLPLTFLLAALMMLCPLAQAQTNQVQTSQSKPELAEGPCVFAIIVGTGIILWWGLHKLCKLLPKDKKTPNPPTPPPKPPPPPTNSVSKAMSQIAGSGPGAEIWFPSDGSTNEGISYEDISWYTSTNSADYLSPDGRPYATIITTTIQAASSLGHWTNCGTMTIWVTAAPYTLYGVFYDGSGNVMGTGTSVASNGIPQDLTINAASYNPPGGPQEFYRLCGTNQFCTIPEN